VEFARRAERVLAGVDDAGCRERHWRRCEPAPGASVLRRTVWRSFQTGRRTIAR
jgi:hypothetical protein